MTSNKIVSVGSQTSYQLFCHIRRALTSRLLSPLVFKTYWTTIAFHIDAPTLTGILTNWWDITLFPVMTEITFLFRIDYKYKVQTIYLHNVNISVLSVLSDILNPVNPGPRQIQWWKETWNFFGFPFQTEARLKTSSVTPDIFYSAPWTQNKLCTADACNSCFFCFLGRVQQSLSSFSRLTQCLATC